MTETPSALPVIQVLRSSTAYLSSVGVTSSRLEAELLVGHSLGLSRLDLYLQFERPLEESELESVRVLLRRRARGCPVAYLTGEKEFFGLSFSVSGSVLVPRPETELLVELALEFASGGTLPLKVLDLGTGSGCIAVSLASRAGNVIADATDRYADAIEVAARNVARHEVGGQVSLHQGDWVTPVSERGPYALVLSNPPYLTTAEWQLLERSVRDFEPRSALDGGSDGLSCYRDLIPAVSPVVAHGTKILLECDPFRIHEVGRICRASWPDAALSTHSDLSGRDRVLEVTLR
ncbi:MAG: peptide chain release factor N(5)-glutamine methyltransferase [Candidatus Dormibacteria bacterium]